MRISHQGEVASYRAFVPGGEGVLDAPPNPVERLRLEYKGSRGPLGFLELVKSGGAGGTTEGDVYIRSERTRLWTKAPRNPGEQVLGEVPSIVPGPGR